MRCVLASILLLAAPTAMAAHTVTFVIDMREEIAAGRFDPKSARVGVRGGVAPLSWGETVLAVDPDGDGRYEATVTFPRAPFGSQPVAYKFKVEREGPPNSGAKGWAEGKDLRFVEQPDGNHDEISWASRMPDALRFLWPLTRR